MRPEIFSDLVVLQIVAEERSFTRAAARLGVTQSALSQTIKRLEMGLDMKLLARTTRSVSPTDAGDRLLAKLVPSIADLSQEIEALSTMRAAPKGMVRVTSGKHAADTVLWPATKRLMATYPDIQVELNINLVPVDIVAERFDAGVRLAESLEKDMIAVAIGSPLRTAIVGSPGYFAVHRHPSKPDDLVDHRCVSFRYTSGRLYAWEFEKAGRKVTVKVEGGPVLNDVDLMIEAAAAGLGLAYAMEDRVAEHLSNGTLIRVLEDWCAPFGGYYLYYPNRNHLSRALRLFIDVLKDERRAERPYVEGGDVRWV